MKKTAWVVSVVIIILGAYAAIGREMLLVPTEEIRVVADLDSINSTDATKVIATLPIGQPVQVTACRNLLDDQVYRVKAASGAEGFVSGGRFEVKRGTWSESLGKRKVVCY